MTTAVLDQARPASALDTPQDSDPAPLLVAVWADDVEMGTERDCLLHAAGRAAVEARELIVAAILPPPVVAPLPPTVHARLAYERERLLVVTKRAAREACSGFGVVLFGVVPLAEPHGLTKRARQRALLGQLDELCLRLRAELHPIDRIAKAHLFSSADPMPR